VGVAGSVGGDPLDVRAVVDDDDEPAAHCLRVDTWEARADRRGTRGRRGRLREPIAARPTFGAGEPVSGPYPLLPMEGVGGGRVQWNRPGPGRSREIHERASAPGDGPVAGDDHGCPTGNGFRTRSDASACEPSDRGSSIGRSLEDGSWRRCDGSAAAATSLTD
jgi:hypothetical protein